MNRLALLTVIIIPVTAPAASFSLGAVLRAGGPAQDELLLGSTSGTTTTSAGLFPRWLDATNHNFQLSYNASTNVASLSAEWLGFFTSSVNWTVGGGSVSSSPRIWTVSPGAIRLTAETNPAINTSIQVTNLALSGPGLSVINPPNIVAAQTGGGTITASNTTPITFTTPTGGGSWVLNGTVRFTGLASVFGGTGAVGDQLRAAFDFVASDVASVPEPEPMLLIALGFAALGALYHRRHAAALKRPVA